MLDTKFASGQNTFSYVRSYQQYGKIDNPIFKMLSAIADSDKLYSEICTAMEKRLLEKPQEILSRAMLASAQASKKKWEELESTIQPWKAQLEKSNSNDDLPSAIWSIASQIPDRQIGKMTTLLPLLESAAKSKSEQLLSNGFPYSPASLLVHWYSKLDRAEDAKKLLIQAYKESKLDDRYVGNNQAYAESQLFQKRTQIATPLATSGSPVEAYIIFRRLKSDTGLNDRLQSWAGNSDHYLGQLGTAINAKMTPEATLSMVSQSLGLVTKVPTTLPTTLKQEDNKNKTKPKASELKLDKDQVALTMMAKQLESEGANNDLAVRLLQRAESMAVQINQPDLARSLRCDLAVRISKTDPAQCKSILSSTLDELFPKKGKE